MVTKNPLAGTDGLTEVMMKTDIFWDVTPCFGRNFSSDKSQNSTGLNLKQPTGFRIFTICRCSISRWMLSKFRYLRLRLTHKNRVREICICNVICYIFTTVKTIG